MPHLNVLKWVFAILYVFNYKGALFVWHYHVLRILAKCTITFNLPGRRKRLQSAATQKDIWSTRKYNERATFGDLDFNIHKSIST